MPTSFYSFFSPLYYGFHVYIQPIRLEIRPKVIWYPFRATITKIHLYICFYRVNLLPLKPEISLYLPTSLDISMRSRVSTPSGALRGFSVVCMPLGVSTPVFQPLLMLHAAWCSLPSLSPDFMFTRLSQAFNIYMPLDYRTLLAFPKSPGAPMPPGFPGHLVVPDFIMF